MLVALLALTVVALAALAAGALTVRSLTTANAQATASMQEAQTAYAERLAAQQDKAIDAMDAANDRLQETVGIYRMTASRAAEMEEAQRQSLTEPPKELAYSEEEEDDWWAGKVAAAQLAKENDNYEQVSSDEVDSVLDTLANAV